MTSPVVNDVPSNATRSASPARRLVYFVVGLLVFLGALELVVRRNSALFAAGSHRALAKVATFERHPRVEFLFLGTSRTQDGVSPDLATRALAEIAPELGEVPGYNAAFTGSSLDALISLVPRFGFRSDLRVVVIELSDAQIFNQPAPWDEHEPANVTIEDHLAKRLRAIQFIRYRTAFLPDNLGRLPALLIFGPSLTGWETRGSDQVASWLGKKEPEAVGFDPRLWTPEEIHPTAPAQTLNSTNDATATKLGDLSRLFHEHNIKVVFAVPPMPWGLPNIREREELRPLFAEVARRGQCEVWDFAGLKLPDSMFRDASHLGKTGRAHYSRALAIQLAKVLRRE